MTGLLIAQDKCITKKEDSLHFREDLGHNGQDLLPLLQFNCLFGSICAKSQTRGNYEESLGERYGLIVHILFRVLCNQLFFNFNRLKKIYFFK